MRYLFVIGLMGILSCAQKGGNRVDSVDSVEVATRNHARDVIKQMQGVWVHDEDSLATVEVSDNQWIFKYEGEFQEGDKFTITISDTLTEFVNKEVKADFVILSNSDNIMHYEIMGLDKRIMSLMYFPRGNTHVYKKMK
jgi:hypothetical protein